MKYWNELNELENSIIDLELIKSNLRVISNGAECSNQEDLLSAVEFVTKTFEEKMKETLDNFQYLFVSVSADSKNTEYVEPSEGVLELDRIVRGWSNK